MHQGWSLPHQAASGESRFMSQFDMQIRAIARQYEILSKGDGQKANIVAEAILRCIENGYWQPDDKMPAELSLVEALPVSLGTVQAAYRMLANEGVVARRRKDGTRLTSQVDVNSLNWHLRFSDIETDASLPCRSTVLSITKTRDFGGWNRFLSEVEEFTCIARRWSIGERFQVLSRLYISAEFRALGRFGHGHPQRYQFARCLQRYAQNADTARDP